MHKLRVENCVLFGGLAEDLSPGGSLSDGSEALLPRGQGRARVSRGFCNKDQVVGTLKDHS